MKDLYLNNDISKQQVQPVIHRIYQEVVNMAVTVTITTHDGKVYTDPSKIKIPRNENTELFYQLLENYVCPKEKETAS